MLKELFRIELQQTSLNVTQGVIDSVRNKHLVKSGCRVYDNGFIGIAGTLGEATEATWQQAEENLKRHVPYPYPAETGKTRQEDRTQECLTISEFTARCELLLARLRTAFPRLIFSNKINMDEIISTLTNDQGLNYRCRDIQYSVSLLAKDQDSPAVFETGAMYQGRTFDVDEVFQAVTPVLQAHGTLLPMPECKTLPLICETLLLSPLEQMLQGQMFHRGASLLSGKLGQQLFSPDFTLRVDKSAGNWDDCFFDSEGTVLPGDQISLIDHGVLVRTLADKKTAAEFDCESTACGGGRYDDLPQLTGAMLSAAPSGKTLRELLNGRDAALVLMASGGDCTAEGVLATPVQTAYLYRDGKLLGRLPEFNARGSLFELFGQGYLGLSQDKPFCGVRWMAAEAELL